MKNLLPSLCLLWCCIGAYGQISTSEVLEAQAQQELIDPHSVTLKPGFWAKSGSVFHAHIGYAEINMDCPIVTEPNFAITHIDPNSYNPSSISNALKLALSYDSAGNTSRIYYANASSRTTGVSAFSIKVLASLIYVYPNPTSGSITVSWDDSIDAFIRSAVLVTSNSVSLPMRIANTGGKRQASLSFSGSAGYYFLQVRLSDNRIVSKKIIKY